jgi:hypothetical protein
MKEFVGGVTVSLVEDVKGVLTAHVEVAPGVETDAEMIVCLAASALVDFLNCVEDQQLLPNRAARRAASRRRH